MNRLPNQVIDAYEPGSYFFGVPVDSMSADELRASLLWYGKMEKKRIDRDLKNDMAKVDSMFAEIKARRGGWLGRLFR